MFSHSFISFFKKVDKYCIYLIDYVTQFQGIIRLCPQDILNPIYASGATTSNEDRPPVSRSYQEYDTDKKDYPITQQLLKREGMIQCSGEASYCDDIPKIQDEVFASFVLSSVSNAEILTIDGSDALVSRLY